MSHKKAVYKFLDEMNYFFNPNVIGVLMFDAYTINLDSAKNSILLHVVMKEDTEVLTRGSTIQNEFKIQYSEISIEALKDAVCKGNIECNGVDVSLICRESIIFDTYGRIRRLQDCIFEEYRDCLLSPADSSKATATDIYNKIIQLQLMAEANDKSFDYIYPLVIEEIRQFYSKISGCADIPVTKVLKVYTDEKYRRATNQTSIPETEFIVIYLKAVYSCENNSEKVKIIKELYSYITRNVEFDSNHYITYAKNKGVFVNQNKE